MALQGPFHNRGHAGRELAKLLLAYKDQSPQVLALPRGGVPVAYEVAEALEAPLDVWVARKVGAPIQPELGMGAVAEGGEVFLDAQIVHEVGASEAEVQAVIGKETAEVEERCRRFRHGRAAPNVSGKTAIVVDDGLATGGTARAALRALRRLAPRRLVLAVPVGSQDSLASLREEADEIVCLSPEPSLFAIGLWYEDFQPVQDDDVIAMLDRAQSPRAASVTTHEDAVHIDVGDAVLQGDLSIPRGALGLVLFAHGSGSSRKSRRNRGVAEELRRAGFATLLFDLLTEDEEAVDAVDAHLRFDIDLLAGRLTGATDWTHKHAKARSLRIGYFGASTGAAAALIAAVERSEVVNAVVSRGGRPDLAGEWLARVRAPTLLIVGGDDREVLRLNRSALEHLKCANALSVVPHATHLFGEPGALDQVAQLAANWFQRHLGKSRVEARADGTRSA
jgi:putative phosphoribosyl transferase